MICNYIIKKRLKLNDPLNENYGGITATFRLSQVFKANNLNMEDFAISTNNVTNLRHYFTQKMIFQDDDRRKEDYGEVFYIEFVKVRGKYDWVCNIWDGVAC